MQFSKKQQRQASIAAISGLVIIGAASLFFKTYPHLNPFSCTKGQEKKEDSTSKEGESISEASKTAETAETEETEEFSPVNADDAN
jgi:hypothetical protein